MANKKKAGKTIRKTFKSSPSSYVSLIYGVLTVIVLFTLIFLGSKVFSQKQKGQITDNAAAVVRQDDKEIYTVSQGDSLWSISEKYYGDGFKWVDIASANKISTPGSIEVGQKIRIPTIAKKIAVQNQKIESVSSGIPGNKYTVQKGDDLWNIAVRKYADGYRWVEIARANNLENPSIIHSGNVLILPKS